MIFKKETTLISIGDFIELYYKIKQKGLFKILSLFKFNSSNRVQKKWDEFAPQSDFWVIPQITKHWNTIISNNPNVSYEEYVCETYLKNKSNLSLLSIGCGEGIHERNFANKDCFSKIVGVDISSKSIEKAILESQKNNLDITYFAGDFLNMNEIIQKFDVILFDSSLHHFENIDGLLKEKIKPLLNENGILVVFEFCGPNRLQWKNSQLNKANELLKKIPQNYKLLIDGKNYKKKVYRPGMIRMLLNDPSEAPDSKNLIKGIHNNFKTVEEKLLGWNILHILLKNISHNFTNSDKETDDLMQKLIREEEKFCKETSENNAVFGIYKK